MSLIHHRCDIQVIKFYFFAEAELSRGVAMSSRTGGEDQLKKTLLFDVVKTRTLV